MMSICQSGSLINMIRVKNELIRKMRTTAVPIENRSRSRMSLQVTMCTWIKNSRRQSNSRGVRWRQQTNSSNSRSEVSNATTASRTLHTSVSQTRMDPNELSLREGIMMRRRRKVPMTVGCRQDQLQERQLHSFETRSEAAQSSRVFQQDQMRRQLQRFQTRSELGARSSRVLQEYQVLQVRQLHSFPPPTSSSGEQNEVEALAHKDMAVRCRFHHHHHQHHPGPHPLHPRPTHHHQ